MELTVTDGFCGAGGTSDGCRRGGARLVCAINHWDRAIDTHSANFPEALHLLTPIDKVDPRECPYSDLFCASPECTHFTIARGARKRSKSSRSLAWNLLPFIEFHRYPWLSFENVVEFAQWGPLDRHGKPIEKRKGETFHAWLKAIESYGYRLEYRILNAADYGAATSRERLFILGRRGTKGPVWPEPTHAGNHKSFLSVMDRSIHLRGIHSRTKPLCETTLKWLRHGREKFGESTWIHGYYGNATLTPITVPLPTITTRDRFALVDCSSGEFATRMLSNHELAAAQGFSPGYEFCGNKREVTMQIGNSVPPPFSEAITRAILSA